MKFAIAAEKKLRSIPTTEIELSVEDGNPEVSVKVDEIKWLRLV
jgi:HAE1 family hydrophobic/amphiphilic exporter-1